MASSMLSYSNMWDGIILNSNAWTLLPRLSSYLCSFIPILCYFYSLLFRMQVSLLVQSARAKWVGVDLFFLGLLILTRVPFIVKCHKESLLWAETSPCTQLSIEPQSGYVTEAWELILSRCLQRGQRPKGGNWNDWTFHKGLMEPRPLGWLSNKRNTEILFRETSKHPINSQERWEAKTLQRT